MSVVNLFGPVSVQHEGRVVRGADFGGCRPRVVLALLALAPGAARSRDEIAEALWEGRPPRGYVATLHGYVCLLRRSLAGIGAGDVLVTRAHGYLLDADLVTVDLAEGHRQLASGDPERVLDALEIAAHGLLVDEPYAAWAEQARSDWEEAVAVGATRAADVARASGEPGTAIRLARAALRSSPYCEPALRALMSALVSSGQPARALEVYADTRRRFRDELGIEVGEESRALYLDLLGRPSSRPASDLPVLVRLLRDALEEHAPLDVHDPVVRDVGRLLRERVG